VSVIIPSYNYGRFLSAAVLSALSQQDVDPQVIVVDDASSDDSAAIAERIARSDRRVSLVRHARNTGPAIAFNDGYALATGEFIVRLDADDLLTAGSLARSAALFDAFPEVGLVYGHPLHFYGKVPDRPSVGVRSWSIWSGPDWIAERCRRGVNCITTPEAMVRTSVMTEVGPLSTQIQVATDLHMWLRVAAVSSVGRVDGADQALHREHAASITGRSSYSEIVDLTERQTVFDDFFASDAGQDLVGSARLHRSAQAALADEALARACRAYDRGRTGSVDVQAYVDFAMASYPATRSLQHWRALRRRQLLGTRLSAVPPLFMATQIGRRLRSDLLYRRWARTGL
jgi:cellulose synthase/poly-beta-1,6-N-acetylglucosamine synthase-like glycosyltransferase